MYNDMREEFYEPHMVKTVYAVERPYLLSVYKRVCDKNQQKHWTVFLENFLDCIRAYLPGPVLITGQLVCFDDDIRVYSAY